MRTRLLPYAIIFIIIETLTRISLMARAVMEVGVSASDAVKALGLGLWFDLATLGFFMILPALLYLFTPAHKHGSTLDRRLDMGMRFVFAFVLLFTTVAEHLFWSEFSTRFNFIAVDYLVYTTEVIGNIQESYPIHWLLLAVGSVAALITWMSKRTKARVTPAQRFRARAADFAALIAISVGMTAVTSQSWTQFSDNARVGEVSANGVYNLFYAFWDNEINYGEFYAQHDDAEVAARVRASLASPNATFTQDDPQDFTRIIRSTKPEQHKNVMLVVMESMSADYMAAYGNTENLTPNLDRLATEGLFFTNLYATGTRTVRGLEAITLSIPPTPGQSIVRRPENEGLFSLGYIFKDRGYDTRFLYGGYGYFDNMNAFFAGNGFDVVDRTMLRKQDVTFANVWGVCDEDMFTRAIQEADASYAKGKPFMTLLMTTSNHRPYTYPEGRIDIPSHSGRTGGVKYADYAVGKLVEDAKKKPWFKDTVFVFVADHTAGAGGKAELDGHKYHIPMIFYAPDMIAPQRITPLASQIDLAPSLLDMLHFSYLSKFYGIDQLDAQAVNSTHPRSFISNFQKVAMVRDAVLTVLAPKRSVLQLHWPEQAPLENADAEAADEAIALYQSASWWKERYRRIPTVVQ
jgi:phosphoglycerol transferase MdoB-like AlkP superfamily enzyme